MGIPEDDSDLLLTPNLKLSWSILPRRKIGVHKAAGLAGHTDAVTAVALIYNTPCAVTSSEDGTLWIWDLDSCMSVDEIGSDDERSAKVSAIAVHPAGHSMVTVGVPGNPAALLMWDLRGLQHACAIGDTDSAAKAVRIVGLLSAASSQPRPSEYIVQSLEYLPDGRGLAVGYDSGAIAVFNMVPAINAMQKAPLPTASKACSGGLLDQAMLQLSDDGASPYGELPSLNVLDLRYHKGAVLSLAAAAAPGSISGSASSCSVDGLAVAGTCIPQKYVLASGGRDGMVCLWDISADLKGGALRPAAVLGASGKAAGGAGGGGGGGCFGACFGASAAPAPAAAAVPAPGTRGHEKGEWVSHLSFTPGCRYLVSVDFGGRVVLWDVAARTALSNSQVPGCGVWSMALLPYKETVASVNTRRSMEYVSNSGAAPNCIVRHHTLHDLDPDALQAAEAAVVGGDDGSALNTMVSGKEAGSEHGRARAGRGIRLMLLCDSGKHDGMSALLLWDVGEGRELARWGCAPASDPTCAGVKARHMAVDVHGSKLLVGQTNEPWSVDVWSLTQEPV